MRRRKLDENKSQLKHEVTQKATEAHLDNAEDKERKKGEKNQ